MAKADKDGEQDEGSVLEPITHALFSGLIDEADDTIKDEVDKDK